MDDIKLPEESILSKTRIQRSLQSFMRTVLYDFEEYALENPLLLKHIRNTNLVFTESEECYTNGKRIVLGLNSPLFKSVENNNVLYKKAQGIIMHELGHVFFTNFDAVQSFLNKATQNYKKLSNAAKEVLNILEDLRIEEKLAEHNPYNRKLFLMNRLSITKNIVEEFKTRSFDSDSKRAIAIMDGALAMGFLQKPIKTTDRKTNQLLLKVFPIAMKAVRSNKTEEIIHYTDQVMKMIQTLDIPEQEKRDVSSTNTKVSRRQFGGGTSQPLDGTPADMAGNRGEGEEQVSNGPASEQKNYNIGDALEQMGEEEVDEEEIDKMLKELSEEVHKETERVNNKRLTSEIIEGYFNEELEKTIEEEEKKIGDLTKDLPEHHQLPVYFTKKKQKYTRDEYEEIKNELNFAIKSSIRKLQEMIEWNEENLETNKLSGVLDTHSLTRFAALDEIDIFQQTYSEEKTKQLEVMLLIDCSGSNGMQVKSSSGKSLPRYVVNQMMSIYLHEVLKGLNFKHSIWGFDSGTRENVSVMVPFSDCFSKDSGLHLADIGARAANRDGLHIRLAGKTLNDFSETDDKLLIVVSDGQPAAPGFSGERGMKDVVAAQEELKEIGVQTIGIFTGSPSENRYFEDMYEEHAFLNNDSIFEFDKILFELLSKQFNEQQ